MCFFMCDFNAKIVNENSGLKRAMGKNECRNINENGERLVDFCVDLALVIGTWKSPDGKKVYRIDHLMINRRWRRSLLDLRVLRCADLYTDQFLVVGSIRLKLKIAYHKKSSKKRYDVSRLKNEWYRKSIAIGFDPVSEHQLAHVLTRFRK